MLTLAQAIKAIREGARDVGVLNGIPAVRDEYTPRYVASDHDMTCYHESDGTEVWRHTGLGSV